MITDMKKSAKKGLFTTAVALLLVFALIAVSYGSTIGEVVAYGSTYISEVKVFSGNSLKNAIDKCKAAGYNAVGKNINRTEDGDDDDDGIYIVGYKTTEDPEEGITGISMLQMNSGYQDYTYGDVAEQAVEKMGNIPSELEQAVMEFADNYKAGSPAAVSAAKTLNCYSVDEQNNMPLGDYLVSGKCNVDFVKKLLVRSSTAVVTAFCNALVAGVADYNQDKSNWATRLGDTASLREELQDGSNFARLDKIYKSYAVELADSVQKFAESFHEAESRYYANNNKVDVPEVDEKDVTELPEETADELLNCGEIQTEDGDALILYAYDILNNYTLDGTTKLGEYIVSLGDKNLDVIAELRSLYPLVDSLTFGQTAAMRLSGVTFCAIYLVNEAGLTEKADEQINAIIKDIKSETGKTTISVWEGVDQTVYNQKVAVTSAAYRSNSAGQIYGTLTTPDEMDTFLSEAMSKLSIVMSVIGVAYGVTTLVGMTIGYMSAFAIGSVGVSASVWAVCCAGIGSSVMGTLFGALGCAFIVLNYVALVAMVVLLVVIFAKWIWDMFNDRDDEDFTPIPLVMYDVCEKRYVKYDVVKEGNSPSNINGEDAKRWNALYTTKSRLVGEPICSGDVEDLIAVQYGDSKSPIGYSPVTCFGEVTAANLNANTDEDNPNIFMFTKTTVNEINEGEAQTGSLYLSKLLLSSEETETAAKANLTRSGFKIIDINLTPVVDKGYTYLGFTTTTNIEDAITDIRISPRNSADIFMFGNASYTSCGTTPVGDTLYYTSYDTAGVPILADIQVKSSLKDAPEGYEPVNMFCGGNAYNLNMGSEVGDLLAPSTAQDYDHWNDRGSYIFFKPSVTFTEGTEYISGLVAVAGMNMKSGGNSALNYCEELGLTNLDADLTYGWKSNTYYRTMNYEEYVYWKNVNTILCYSTTHNPYRAIYGIRSYTAAPNNSTLSSSMGSMVNGAYAVCDVLYQLPDTCGSKPAVGEMSRGVYQSHSYQFVTECGTSCGMRDVSAIIKICPEDDETVDWKYSGVRGKGLYVLGPTEGGTPLTLNDIVVSDKAETPEGFVSVQDFKNPNRTEPHNLSYNGYGSDYRCEELVPLYIYVRQEAPVEKKYISSISVVTFSLDKMTGGNTDKLDDKTKLSLQKTCNDYCIQSLIQSCTDEIIPANLAVDSKESFYSDCNTKTYRASYIGVTRTDSESKAITGILRYVTNSDNVLSTIQVDGVSYTKAGDKIPDPKGSYYLYYTNSGGSNPGKPITEIEVSSDVFIADAATAMSASSIDIPEKKNGTEVISEAVTASSYGDSKSSTFIHMYYTDDAMYMGAIYIGHGKTKKEAQCNLLSLGCNMCIDMDLNKNTNGEYVYIGYTRYALFGTELKKGVPKYAVRDILLTVGEAPQKNIKVNGLSYKIASDEYTSVKDYAGGKAVSLNIGTGGKQIYLYYSTSKPTGTTEPISRLGASCRDYSLLNTTDWTWENIVDKDGNRVNVNDGAFKTTDDGDHIVDNRIYLYAARCNNDVKQSAAVTAGQISTEFVSYDVYMKGVK